MRFTYPGFYDLQVNGFGGLDFNQPSASDQVSEAAAALRRTGVTRFLPTIITSTCEHFARCAAPLTRHPHPAIGGIHMEGPYISPMDGPRGAHDSKAVCAPAIDDFKRRQDAACGRIVLVTLAPEVAGALEMIEYLVDSGVRVALGHTAAQPEQVRDAIKAGASLSTHLGNGCASVLPRHPNLIWEQLAADELLATLIVDGHHLAAATVKSMIRAKTVSRTILVTDAIAAAGCAPGYYTLSGTRVELAPDGRVSEPGKPWLAGSSLAMNQAVANTVRFTGLELGEVLPMASSRPAAFLGQSTAGTVTFDWDPHSFSLSVESVMD